MLTLFNTYLSKLNTKKIDESTSEIKIDFANSEKFVNNIRVTNKHFFEDINNYAGRLQTISFLLFKEMDEISKNYIFKIIKKYGQKKNDYWYLNYKEKSYLKVSIIDLCDLNIDGVKIINDGFTFNV